MEVQEIEPEKTTIPPKPRRGGRGKAKTQSRQPKAQSTRRGGARKVKVDLSSDEEMRDEEDRES